MAKKMKAKTHVDVPDDLDGGGRKVGPLYPMVDIEGSGESVSERMRKAVTFPVAMDEPEESHDEKEERITEEYAAEVSDPSNPLFHEHILGWYVKNQIQASPLTPAEIAERSGVSVSQIYRFLKGERSLTLESADKLLPVVGRSLVESIRGYQREETPKPQGFEGEIEDEKERLRRRLDDWEKGAFLGVRKILEDVGHLSDRIRKMIDDL